MTPPTPRRGRARTALRGIGPRRSPLGGIGPGTGAGLESEADDEVLALVADPYGSVADAEARLLALESLFRERGDRRAVFLAIYARVTERVGAAIEAGEFADPEWVADYLVAFANYYRRALLAFEQGNGDLPEPWRLAFEVAARGDCLVVQDAVLGINAHVNYDLALALREAGLDGDRRQKYADHCRVNEVLEGLVDEAQDVLAGEYDAPGLADVDAALGRLDEVVSVVTITEGRDSAWRTAVALGSRWWVRRRIARWVMAWTATGAARLVASPTASDRVRAALRDREAGGAAVE